MWAALSQGNIPEAIRIAAETPELGQELASELVDLAQRKLFEVCGLAVDLKIKETARTRFAPGQVEALRKVK